MSFIREENIWGKHFFLLMYSGPNLNYIFKFKILHLLWLIFHSHSHSCWFLIALHFTYLPVSLLSLLQPILQFRGSVVFPKHRSDFATYLLKTSHWCSISYKIMFKSLRKNSRPLKWTEIQMRVVWDTFLYRLTREDTLGGKVCRYSSS